MRFLLSTLNAKYIHLNLAIRLLYELNKTNADLAWREFTIKDDLNEIATACAKYEVVAFSCYIWNIVPTLKVCTFIKQLNPETKILLGGPEVSYDWEDTIALPQVDYIITGEGETPFAEFLKLYPNVQQVPSLIYKNSDTVVKTLESKTFDLLNFEHTNPYQNDDVTTLKNKVLYIETSRGCPYKCEFCLASLDNKVRYLPHNHIKSNLLFLMAHGKTIKFLDRTFNIKKDFTIDIFKFILAHHKPGQVFQFEITADIVHPDIVSFINEHVPKGLFRFEIGIQTVNQIANLEVSRKQNFDKTKGVILQLMDKIEMHLDLIVGLPLDYYEDIKYSFEEVFKIFAPELQLGFLKFLKGTPMRTKALQHGYEYDNVAPYQIIKSNYLSAEELNNITQLEHALEIYWNKPRAINTLKYVTTYYSIFDFLQGLGAYFGTLKDYHKFNHQDIYDILFDYAKKDYPEDIVLHQLIAIDYYLAHKIKPQILYISEIEKTAANKLLRSMQGFNQNLRYIMFNINFDFEAFEKTILIEKTEQLFVAEYTGIALPKIIIPIFDAEKIEK
jgi:anaerobic magnesium-protoporphyrin IX monomethyl ester cyclase